MRKLPGSVAEDFKYAPSSPCLICGQPTRSVAMKCQKCLEAIFLKEELKFAKEWLRSHPEGEIELGRDRRRLTHLVCYRTPKLAWCGTAVVNPRLKRPRVKQGGIPADVCAVCCIKMREG